MTGALLDTLGVTIYSNLSSIIIINIFYLFQFYVNSSAPRDYVIFHLSLAFFSAPVNVSLHQFAICTFLLAMSQFYLLI